ncbi:MAG: 2-oxoglutarate dehydrogenase complex dihydrolipoyllysine-residue succinyltransferase [Roseitalea sp.]|jgi:2-oxoglutarate dehydrogenase E2 component (dihydrolipoamide succinyltransferase)|uniref:Dihydrolipoyllysine-residue succinyltransferase component of 2-oxoglutarate dehydrogenase complex n=1 Tax=Oceaniradius stylonematis TaxID=2184161 RepID=A0A3A8ACB7_9HYPH|nr:2-oxoglutarate dehydrogenase complex dihydrolipoyllysine-residue succinyltransferase [Oceaniradius stylonematis]MBO6554413.1 2-oxoglutarate dehydrogenase complex dihydrolipoyllysine-residue succinyltransferase [Roseitalea sp.]MBO6953426.1 2-oxoglutarate dehydrogenase complex dihydrolipoyllysine-residue succinyltransferase [Rhizobiaceae bacterium]MBO6593805.1 2-oxoglutarate dehydrogenase complex dihydrolipoyllysine-residue succinyltransferase [Roseitalea sp.]MBO6601170.1 2-oxoglutarate dehydr
MAKEIRVPTLGESVTEATIGQWFKQPGDAVADGETLVELETDKVTLEVPSPGAGTLGEIVANEGDTVEVDALLGMLTEGDGAGAAAASGGKTADAKKDEETDATPEPAPSGSETESPGMKDAKGDMPPAPSAAKMMEEKGMSADQVDGSGKRGQVLKSDVLEAVAKGGQAAPAPSPAPQAARPPSSADDQVREERVRMTKLRQTIARRLKDAQNTAAMLTTYNEVDMSAVMAMRRKYKDLFEKKHDVKLGFMGFFTKAVTHALKEIPSVNAEIDGTDIIFKNYAHIGVAVGTDKGLVVPVVRDADRMSIAEVELEIGRLGKAARDGNLSMADMQGGTFTISNGGVYGSLMSSPILNAPQSGILGMHKIQERPVAINGEVVIRPMMYLALSYDHRIVDGKEAVTFLVRVKESLEDPERFVLDL